VRLECKHVWQYISDYIDGSVSPDQRADIENHLAHCEICSAILDSVHNILILTADDRVFALPIGYSERLRNRNALEVAAAGNSSGDDESSDG
jgi:predicted anti-sigma-YlaC factor YlaD